MSKDKLVLKDNTVIELEAGASLSALTAIFPDKTAMVATWDNLTPENLATVSVQNGEGLAIGNYTDLVLMEPNMTATAHPDGTVRATFGLCEKTDIEKRLDAIEGGQQTQDGAIEDMAAVVSTIAEQTDGGKA